MAQVIGDKTVFSSGEALPAAGSDAYKLAQSNPQAYISNQPAPQTAPSNPTPITPDALSSTVSPYTVQPQTSTQTKASAAIQGATEGIFAPLIQEQQTKVDTLNPTVEDQRGYIRKLVDKLSGKGEAQITEEQKQGIPEKSQLVTDITNEYNTKQLDYRRQIEALQKTPGGTTGGTADAIRAVERQRDSELADIAIRQSVAQNNLATAQNLVNRKIDLEFGDLKDQISYAQNFLNEYRDDLSKAEQNKLELQIKDGQQKLDDKKTLEDTKLKALFEAQSNGADQGTIRAIQAATTPEEAFAAAGDYIGLMDRAYKQAQIANIRSEIEKRNSESNGIGDPSQIIAYAQQYASTGTIPPGLPKGTFGIVSQYAKELPKGTGTLVDKNTGIVPSSSNISSEKKDALISLYNAVQKADDLKTQFSNIIPGVIGGITGKISGSKAQNDYTTARDLALKELQYALSGKAITQPEYNYFAGLLPSRWNNAFFIGVNGEDKIDSFKKNVGDTLTNKLNGYNASIYGYSKVKVDGEEYTVGDIVKRRDDGLTGRINADGSVTLITQ